MFMDGNGSATQQKYKYNVVQFKYIDGIGNTLKYKSNTKTIQIHGWHWQWMNVFYTP